MEDAKSWIHSAQKNAIKYEQKGVQICVHVLLDREEELFTAHCLEFDIVTDGKTKKEVRKNIINSIVSHVSFCLAMNNESKMMNPAPQEYWNKFYFTYAIKENPFIFPKEFTYEDNRLPFLRNLIPEVEFNSSVAYA